jgi:hypothetical protein
VKLFFFLSLIFSISLTKAEVLGQMTASGLVYVITSDICKTADGKDAKGWLLSYSYNSIGMATRSCYQKYNDNIWIWEFSGREYIFPANNFKLVKS